MQRKKLDEAEVDIASCQGNKNKQNNLFLFSQNFRKYLKVKFI